MVVLGAGPAGLAAAWRAAERGRSVLVLERAPAVGGMAASFEVAGVRVDHGSHRLHPATPPAVLGPLRELLGYDLQTRPRHGRLRLYGRWVGFPLRPGELLRALPPRAPGAGSSGTRCCGRSAAAAPTRTPACCSASSGRSSTARCTARTRRSCGACGGDRIDPEQARRRVSAGGLWGIAARSCGRTRAGRAGSSTTRGAASARSPTSWPRPPPRPGRRIETGAEVETVRPLSDRSRWRTADGRTVAAGHVLSTVPLPVLARLVRPQPAAGLLADAGRLRFRAMVLVYLVHAGGRWSPYDAHYLPGPETPVTRLSEPANYR